jgi:hypothetical protein
MTFTLDVVDQTTGHPITGATISINGNNVSSTDGGGYTTVDAGDTDTITASKPGYVSVSIFGGMLEETGQMQLVPINAPPLPATINPITNTLTPAVIPQPAVISPSPAQSGISTNDWLLIAAAAGGLLLLSNKKKVSGLGKLNKKTGLAIGIGVVAVGGIYLYMKGRTTTTQNTSAINPIKTGVNAAPGSPASLVAQSSGIFASLSKLFTGPNTSTAPGSAAAAAQAASPTAIAVTDQPPAYVDPAAAIGPPPLNAPVLQYTEPPAPDPSVAIDPSQADLYSSNYDSVSGLPECDPARYCGGGVMKGLLPTMVPLPVIGALAGLALMSSKKKVGDAGGGSFNYTPLVIIGGIGVLAYVILNKLTPGPSGKTTDAPAIAAQTAATQAAALASAAAKQTATMNSAQANSIATDLYTQFGTYSSFSGGITDAAAAQIVQDMNQINNDTDFYAVSAAFGTKQLQCNIVGYGCTSMDLLTALETFLNSDNKTFINNNFTTQGMSVYIS